MRFTLPSLFALASVAVATAVVKDPNGRAANPTSPNPYLPENQPSLTKRGCFLGILCLGTSAPDYSSDENNCGQKYKVCSTVWPNGWGSQCSNGVCGPAYCYNLFDFNWLTGKCQDVSSDLSNCGKCGQTCTASSITGASSASCISGTCTASACRTGYTLSSGTCTLNVNTQTDLNNCGTRGNVCQSSWAYGTGRQCLAGICQPVSCSDGFDFNFSTNKCQDVRSDTSNCGKCGNVCSFPNGYGSCSSGSCTLSTCRSGFYKVDGVCTSLDLSSDASNCGSVGNDCTSKYPNGVGICSNGNCALGSCVDGYKSVSQTSCGLIFLFCSTTTTCTKVDTSSDSDNCGSIGNKCAASYANGYNPRCSNGACQATCNNGYSWDSSLFYCRATTNDVNNCGECNNRCPSLNGTPQCNNGVCSYASCNTGYYLVNGACTALTLSSDVNNCGAVGTKCPASYPNGNGVTCASGVCRATTCNPGYDWDATTKTCRNVLSDTQNCGRCNNVCSFPNGSGSCLSGSCTLSKCNTGFQNVNGACTSMDITSDVNNCGAVGKVCVFPLGQGTCSAGSCTYTSCNAPYALKSGSCTAVDTNTDVKNCGSIGNVCPVSYNNGGAGQCVNGDCRTTCNAGFDFDTDLNYCRDVTSDVNNCGRCGGVCSLNGAMATKCVYSKCYATSCKSGYYLQGGVCNGIDTTSDTSNCGGIGKVCSFTPTGAVGTCQNSVCTVTSCPAGYIISSNICVKSSASQRARAKKSKITAPKSLCPDNETACPIAGAASYAMAVSHHFSAFGDLTTGMDGAGGFECLDTTQALDSCGGCASTGEGQDCTKIPSAVGVGCDSGACVVFSCQAGWRPNLAGTKCIRAHHQHDSSNSTRSHGSRRHLAARHGHHGHGHS